VGKDKEADDVDAGIDSRTPIFRVCVASHKRLGWSEGRIDRQPKMVQPKSTAKELFLRSVLRTGVFLCG
jgi:hypothetical protein